MAKAKIEFKATINKPHTDKFELLSEKFGSAFNITETEYMALTPKQKNDAELDLAIAIKCGKIKCPANYKPVAFTLLDQLRRERNW